MAERSDFLIGKDIYVKLVILSEDQGSRLRKSLLQSKTPSPFGANEFLMNYLISKDKRNIFKANNLDNEYNNLIAPQTEIFVSRNVMNLDELKPSINMEYNDFKGMLLGKMITMDKYSRYISNERNNIRSAVILSKKVTGNLDNFLVKHSKDRKLVSDALIHISYLHHVFQNKYFAVHGDPKTQNYIWLELSNPVTIIYDFRDSYDDSNDRIIRRRNVKHIFYLADMEFVFSKVPLVMNVGNVPFNFYFKTDAAWYGNQTPRNLDLIYVPKISSDDKYQLNFNLYGGYDYEVRYSKDAKIELYKYYPKIFPRMFSIDILTLIKMLLTYWYVDEMDKNIVRILNMYFTKYISLSLIEENDELRNTKSYINVSPASFAVMMNKSN